jgi:hypothetical protein
MKKMDNSCKKWKEQDSYPTTCKPMEGTGEGGLPTGKHKSWQVFSIALAFCCLERSYRDLSPLKQIVVLGDWIAAANRLAPVLDGRDYGTSKIPPVGVGSV